MYGEFFWYNGAEHGSKRFEYVHDGNWHFVIVDLTKEASGAEWQSSAEINWFRLDFANNIDTDKTYSVDIAYICNFCRRSRGTRHMPMRMARALHWLLTTTKMKTTATRRILRAAIHSPRKRVMSI